MHLQVGMQGSVQVRMDMATDAGMHVGVFLCWHSGMYIGTYVGM